METKLLIPDHWEEKQVILSLYYLVADADFRITHEEIEMIDKKVEILLHYTFYSSPELRIKIVNEAISFSVGLSDGQKMEAVRLLSARTRLTEDLFVHLISDLEDIAQADDYVSIEEHSLMYYIRLKFRKDYVRSPAFA